MAQRPRTVPLFDLVPSKKIDAAARPATIATTDAAAETPAPAIRELKPVARDSAPSEYGPRAQTSDAPKLVPLPVVYVGIFLALLLALGAYLLGTSVGAKQKEQELAGVLRKDPPTVKEAAGNTSPLGNLQSQPQRQSSRPNQATPPPAPAETLLAGVAFPNLAPESFDNPPPKQELMIADDTVQGWATTDPRQRGLNYMTLGILSRRDAGYAVMMLHANGVPALAVPVDKGGVSANNQGPANYRVWLLQGITGEQFRSDDPLKDRLDKRVREVGKAWKQQAKGPTDFADAFWDKLD